MFSRIKRIVMVILLLFIPMLLFAQNESALNRILQTRELRVGTSGKQPPFTVKSKDGTLMGYEIDLANLLTEAMGVELRFIEKPFSELLPAMERGEIDVIMSGMTITPERNLRVAFAGPYIVSGKSILAKEKRLSDLDEMEEINRPQITVAAIEGTTSQRFVENLIPRSTLITTPDYESAVEMVLKDQVDILLADYPICVLSILRHPNAGLDTIDEPLTIEPIGIALPPNDFLLHNMIRNYLNALEMMGILADLETQWFEDGGWLIRLP